MLWGKGAPKKNYFSEEAGRNQQVKMRAISSSLEDQRGSTFRETQPDWVENPHRSLAGLARVGEK